LGSAYRLVNWANRSPGSVQAHGKIRIRVFTKPCSRSTTCRRAGSIVKSSVPWRFMKSQPECPLLDHALDSLSAFTPDDLVSAVRAAKGLPKVTVPPICLLDFDGDLTDWLVRRHVVARFEPWACFHTTMYVLETDGVRCGIIPRTIGGPYSVLIAEQLHVSGARLILGLTSAGRVSPSLPLPSFVVVTGAVRDEGTSFHYLPPAEQVCCPTPIADLLTEEVSQLGSTVVQGSVWTTDAPDRETTTQLDRHCCGWRTRRRNAGGITVRFCYCTKSWCRRRSARHQRCGSPRRTV
jgi:hypothetical protein